MPSRAFIAALAVVAACQPGPGASVGLSYADPPGPGWRFLRDPASTPSRLVLNLVGPPGLVTRGVGCTLHAPAALRFGKFAGGLEVSDPGAPGAPSADPEPRRATVVSALREGNLLHAGVYQRPDADAPRPAEAVLLQVALELPPGVGLRPGAALTLAVRRAHVVLADVPGRPGSPGGANVSGWPPWASEISVAVGALTLR
jgi:hypothetical protein